MFVLTSTAPSPEALFVPMIYVLSANHVKNRAESRTMIGFGLTEADVEQFVREQLCEKPYIVHDLNMFSGDKDHPYRLTFKENGPLMWFNDDLIMHRLLATSSWAADAFRNIESATLKRD